MKRIILVVAWLALAGAAHGQGLPIASDSILTTVAANDTILNSVGKGPPLTYNKNLALLQMARTFGYYPAQVSYGVAVGLNAYAFDSSRVLDVTKYMSPPGKYSIHIVAVSSDGKMDSIVCQAFQIWGDGTTRDSGWITQEWYQSRVSVSATDTVLALKYLGYTRTATYREGQGWVYLPHAGYKYLRFYRPNRLASKAKIYYDIFVVQNF